MKPFRTLTTYQSGWLRYDIPAGLAVFLVALPLCLGIALASGAPLFAGLVAGIIGGTVVGLFSGSEVSVSGPAAGLAVIVADSIAKIGSYEGFLVAVTLAGVIQLGLGLLKAGRFSSFFPDAVIKGMLVGIGLVIILKQIPHALGRDSDYEGEFEFQQLADGENTLSEIYRALVTASPGAVVISLISLALLLLWERTAGRGIKFFQNLPAALAVVFLGVGLNYLFGQYMPDWYLGDFSEHMVRIPLFGAGRPVWSVFDFPDSRALANPDVYTVAATVAVVASLETLLNLEASDRLDPYKRTSSPNQELVAQGMGNLLSGLVGGLPITSVVVRTSANVFGGTRTRLSAIVHGLFLLGAVFLAGAVLNYIPLACLAALLIMVGYKLAKPAIFISTWKDGLNQFIPFVVTVLGIVFTDLLIGIALGTLVGIMFILYSNYHTNFQVFRTGNQVVVKLQKDLYFLSKPQLKEALNNLRPGDSVLVDGRNATFIDQDIYNILIDFHAKAALQGIHYELLDVTQLKHKLPRYESIREVIAGE